jgi:hypothetical protein
MAGVHLEPLAEPSLAPPSDELHPRVSVPGEVHSTVSADGDGSTPTAATEGRAQAVLRSYPASEADDKAETQALISNVHREPLVSEKSPTELPPSSPGGLNESHSRSKFVAIIIPASQNVPKTMLKRYFRDILFLWAVAVFCSALPLSLVYGIDRLLDYFQDSLLTGPGIYVNMASPYMVLVILGFELGVLGFR